MCLGRNNNIKKHLDTYVGTSSAIVFIYFCKVFFSEMRSKYVGIGYR